MTRIFTPEATEIIWWLRALIALLDNLGFIPYTNMVAHNGRKLHFQGTRCPLLPLVCTSVTDTYGVLYEKILM